MIKQFKETSKSLNYEIQILIENIKYSKYDENNLIKEFEDNLNDSNEKRLKNQETWYDQMYEQFKRTEKLFKMGKKLKKNVKKYFKLIDEMTNEWKSNKEQIGNNLNDFLVNKIDKLEKEVKKEKRNENYEEITLDNYVVKTEKWKIIQEEETRRKEEERLQKEREDEINQQKENFLNQHPQMNDQIYQHMSVPELTFVEKQMKNSFESIIFDSNENKFNKKSDEFWNRMVNKHDFVFLIETTEGAKFGCFIKENIVDQNEYVIDSKAFIFKLDENIFEKYQIRKNKFAFKISKSENDELFIVGKNDIVVMKQENEEKSFCNQTRSFNYLRKQNVLTGKSEPFKVKQFIAIKMKTPTTRFILKSDSDSKIIESITKDLKTLLSNFLILYKITNVSFGRKSLFLSKKSMITIEYRIPEGFITLEEYIHKNKYNFQEDQRKEIISWVWESFKSVVETDFKSRTHTKLLSLHPKNVLIKVSKKHNETFYEIKFMKYLPELFFENIVNKTSSNEEDELKYIHPEIINILYQSNNLLKDIEKIKIHHSFYSLGYLISFIYTGKDPFYNISLKHILDRYHNNLLVTTYDDYICNDLLNQLLKKLIHEKHTLVEISNQPYIEILKKKLHKKINFRRI